MSDGVMGFIFIACLKARLQGKAAWCKRPKSKGEAVHVKKLIPTFLVPNWSKIEFFFGLGTSISTIEERWPVSIYNYIDHCSLHVTGYIANVTHLGECIVAA